MKGFFGYNSDPNYVELYYGFYQCYLELECGHPFIGQVECLYKL